jgi:hypothetical protein
MTIIKEIDVITYEDLVFQLDEGLERAADEVHDFIVREGLNERQAAAAMKKV